MERVLHCCCDVVVWSYFIHFFFFSAVFGSVRFSSSYSFFIFVSPLVLFLHFRFIVMCKIISQ